MIPYSVVELAKLKAANSRSIEYLVTKLYQQGKDVNVEELKNAIESQNVDNVRKITEEGIEYVSLNQLRIFAKNKKVHGWSRMNREQLLGVLS